MSAAIHVATDEKRPQLQVLAGFLSDALGDELKGTGIRGEIRLGVHGPELRLDFHYHGALILPELAPGETMADNMQRRLWEAEHLIAEMKCKIRDAAAGKIDE